MSANIPSAGPSPPNNPNAKVFLKGLTAPDGRVYDVYIERKVHGESASLDGCNEEAIRRIIQELATLTEIPSTITWSKLQNGEKSVTQVKYANGNQVKLEGDAEKVMKTAVKVGDLAREVLLKAKPANPDQVSIHRHMIELSQHLGIRYLQEDDNEKSVNGDLDEHEFFGDELPDRAEPSENPSIPGHQRGLAGMLKISIKPAAESPVKETPESFVEPVLEPQPPKEVVLPLVEDGSAPLEYVFKSSGLGGTQGEGELLGALNKRLEQFKKENPDSIFAKGATYKAALAAFEAFAKGKKVPDSERVDVLLRAIVAECLEALLADVPSLSQDDLQYFAIHSGVEYSLNFLNDEAAGVSEEAASVLREAIISKLLEKP